MNGPIEKAKLLFEGVATDGMVHISEISQYNRNYYMIEGCLLFGESDDDNFTQWFWVLGDRVRPIGGSYACDGDRIIVSDAYTK